MDLVQIILALTLVIGFYMAWNIGANDVANAMGTSVGSGSLTLKRAVILAAILEFSGAFFAGRKIGNLDWLISPPIDLAVDLDIKIEMAFDLIYRYGVNQSNLLEIMISEDFQGDMDKSNWTSI